MNLENVSERDFLREVAMVLDEKKNGDLQTEVNKLLDSLKESNELNDRLIKGLEEVMNQNGLADFLEDNNGASTEDYFSYIAKQALEGED